jgi:hypothetical protein
MAHMPPLLSTPTRAGSEVDYLSTRPTQPANVDPPGRARIHRRHRSLDTGGERHLRVLTGLRTASSPDAAAYQALASRGPTQRQREVATSTGCSIGDQQGSWDQDWQAETVSSR